MKAVALCLAPVLLTASGSFAAGAMPPRDLLRAIAGFTDTEWAAVERGEAVSKLLDTDAREVAVVGAVRITGGRDRLVARSRDLRTLKGSLVLDVGQFSAVPDPSDLQRVTLDERSLDLRACQPGNCPVRLSAADVGRFQREVNWSAPDWRNQSMAVWRSVLANYARAYLAGGRSALPDYVNRRDALSVASEVAQLAGDYEFVADYSPAFHAYLKEFGSRIPPGAEQMLYWTREDFGIRPIVRISHQVIYSTTAPATPATIIAINQVYADHYLDASLTVTLALDAGRHFDMISVSRARTRSLSGFLRRFARSAVQGRSRNAMRSALNATKVAIESDQFPSVQVPGAGCPVPGFGSEVPGSVQVRGSRLNAQRPVVAPNLEPRTLNRTPNLEPNQEPGTLNLEPRLGYPASIKGQRISHIRRRFHGSADWRRRSGFRGGDDRRTDSIS